MPVDRGGIAERQSIRTAEHQLAVRSLVVAHRGDRKLRDVARRDTNQWRRAPLPTTVTGRFDSAGPRTTIPTHTSMNASGARIVKDIPLAWRCCSVFPFAARNGTGLSGPAPLADMKMKWATPGLPGGIDQIAVAVDVDGLRVVAAAAER